MIKVFATQNGIVVATEGTFRRSAPSIGFDTIFTAEDPLRLVMSAVTSAPKVEAPQDSELRAPIQSQEVWAADPYVVGADSVRRYLTVANECAQAALAVGQ